jgi:hypothetical protein
VFTVGCHRCPAGWPRRLASEGGPPAVDGNSHRTGGRIAAAVAWLLAASTDFPKLAALALTSRGRLFSLRLTELRFARTGIMLPGMTKPGLTRSYVAPAPPPRRVVVRGIDAPKLHLGNLAQRHEGKHHCRAELRAIVQDDGRCLQRRRRGPGPIAEAVTVAPAGGCAQRHHHDTLPAALAIDGIVAKGQARLGSVPRLGRAVSLAGSAKRQPRPAQRRSPRWSRDDALLSVPCVSLCGPTRSARRPARPAWRRAPTRVQDEPASSPCRRPCQRALGRRNCTTTEGLASTGSILDRFGVPKVPEPLSGPPCRHGRPLPEAMGLGLCISGWRPGQPRVRPHRTVSRDGPTRPERHPRRRRRRL